MELNETEQLLDELKDVCMRLGWSLAIDMTGENIDGMVIGNLKYMKSVTEGTENFEEYDFYTPDEMYGVVQ